MEGPCHRTPSEWCDAIEVEARETRRRFSRAARREVDDWEGSWAAHGRRGAPPVAVVETAGCGGDDGARARASEPRGSRCGAGRKRDLLAAPAKLDGHLKGNPTAEGEAEEEMGASGNEHTESSTYRLAISGMLSVHPGGGSCACEAVDRLPSGKRMRDLAKGERAEGLRHQEEPEGRNRGLLAAGIGMTMWLAPRAPSSARSAGPCALASRPWPRGSTSRGARRRPSRRGPRARPPERRSARSKNGLILGDGGEAKEGPRPIAP